MPLENVERYRAAAGQQLEPVRRERIGAALHDADAFLGQFDAAVQDESRVRLHDLIRFAADLERLEPDRRIGDADAVAEAHQERILEPGRAQRQKRCLLDIGNRCADADRLLAGGERLAAQFIELARASARIAERKRVQRHRMVAMGNAGELGMDQLARLHEARARGAVPARRARARGELGRDRPIVGTGAPHRGLDLGGKRDLGDAGFRGCARCFKSDAGVGRRRPHIGHFGRRLDDARRAEDRVDVDELCRRECLFDCLCHRVAQHVRAELDPDRAGAGKPLLLRDAGIEGGDVVDMEPVAAHVRDPARFAGERQIGVADDERRFCAASRRREDHRLRADGAGPAFIAAEIELMLGRDRDHDIDAGVAQFRAHGIEPREMLGFGKGGKRRGRSRVHGTPGSPMVGAARA